MSPSKRLSPVDASIPIAKVVPEKLSGEAGLPQRDEERGG